MAYSMAFRKAAVEKLLAGGQTVVNLRNELGVSRETLYRWLNNFTHHDVGKVATLPKKKRPQDWSAEEKYRALMETTGYNAEEMSVYCRRNGIHVSQLEGWKETCLAGMRKGPKTDPEKKALKAENQDLKRDLRRKEKALAETAALLVLKKKAAEIFGKSEDVDDI